jgi:hypothetical protein
MPSFTAPLTTKYLSLQQRLVVCCFLLTFNLSNLTFEGLFLHSNYNKNNRPIVLTILHSRIDIAAYLAELEPALKEEVKLLNKKIKSLLSFEAGLVVLNVILPN